MLLTLLFLVFWFVCFVVVVVFDFFSVCFLKEHRTSSLRVYLPTVHRALPHQALIKKLLYKAKIAQLGVFH